MGFIENIKKYCEYNKKYTELWTKFNAAILNLEKQLGGIPLYFRHYSRHDSSHSASIIQYLEMLLGEDNITKLSISDQLFIVLAAYAHDIGMLLEHNKVREYFYSSNFAEDLRSKIPSGFDDLDGIIEEILNFPESVKECKNADVFKIYSDVIIVIENIFRNEHAKRGAEQIRNDSTIINVLGIRGTKLLSKICSLHDADINQIMNLPFEENGFFDDYIHPRFVAGLLCLGDLLDLDTDRFDEIILKASSNMPIISKLHKEKHESITHFLVKNGRIEICADCNNHKVYKILNEWVSWIKIACEFLVVHWDEISSDQSILPPRLKQCEITIDGNDEWIKYADSKIHIDASKAVKIFEGSNIYKGKHTFIRELIQNAVDATLIQLYEDVARIKKQNDDGKPITAEYILDCLNNKEKTANSSDISEDVYNAGSTSLNIDNYDIRGRFYEVQKNEYCKNEYLKLLVEDIYDDSVVVFELEDNGTGIKNSEIDSILGLKGKSKELKKKILEIPEFFRPSGIFGIGIQSVFQVASKIVYFTKTENEKAKVITINDPSKRGDVYIKDYDGSMHRGTKVFVLFDSDKFSQNDFNVSDYIYKETSKNSLLLSWIVKHIYNVEKSPIPGIEAKREKEDYFNINVKGYWLNDDKEKDVLIKKSILPEIAENYKNKYFITEEKGLLKYRYYDLGKNCIFDTIILSESDNNSITFGKCDDWNNNIEYMHNIFYRNVFASYDFGNDRWDDICYRRKYIDYKLNIFSDKANNILNIGRDSIKEDFYKNLAKLINYELIVFLKNLIDYCIQKGTHSNRIVFLAFIESKVLGYKCEDLFFKYKDKINLLKVGNYYELKNGEDNKEEYNEIEIPIIDFFEKRICFLKELDEKEKLIIPEGIWKKEEDCKKLDENNVISIYHPDREKIGNNENHFLMHILQGEYYAIYHEKKYKVYETVPYQVGKKYSAPYRAPFIRYQEFLYAVLNDLRCIMTIKGFEVLETPITSGLIDSNHIKNDRAIEVMFDLSIKNEMINILKTNKVIGDYSSLLEDIKKSKVYNNNIEFIRNYKKAEEKKECYEVIVHEYDKLLEELFELLNDNIYKEYLRNDIHQIMNNYNWNSCNGIPDLVYYNYYMIERNAKDFYDEQ